MGRTQGKKEGTGDLGQGQHKNRAQTPQNVLPKQVLTKQRTKPIFFHRFPPKRTRQGGKRKKRDAQEEGECVEGMEVVGRKGSTLNTGG